MLRRSFLKSLALGTSLLGSSRLAKAMLQAENRAGAMPQRTYPALAGPFRLSADWYRNNVTRLQQKSPEPSSARPTT
jgi:hypothetical protein